MYLFQFRINIWSVCSVWWEQRCIMFGWSCISVLFNFKKKKKRLSFVLYETEVLGPDRRASDTYAFLWCESFWTVCWALPSRCCWSPGLWTRTPPRDSGRWQWPIAASPRAAQELRHRRNSGSGKKLHTHSLVSKLFCKYSASRSICSRETPATKMVLLINHWPEQGLVTGEAWSHIQTCPLNLYSIKTSLPVVTACHPRKKGVLAWMA